MNDATSNQPEHIRDNPEVLDLIRQAGGEDVHAERTQLVRVTHEETGEDSGLRELPPPNNKFPLVQAVSDRGEPWDVYAYPGELDSVPTSEARLIAAAFEAAAIDADIMNARRAYAIPAPVSIEADFDGTGELILTHEHNPEYIRIKLSRPQPHHERVWHSKDHKFTFYALGRFRHIGDEIRGGREYAIVVEVAGSVDAEAD